MRIHVHSGIHLLTFILFLLIGGSAADAKGKNEVRKLLYNVNVFAAYSNLDQMYSTETSVPLYINSPQFEAGGQLEFTVYKFERDNWHLGLECAYSRISPDVYDYFLDRDAGFSNSSLNYGPYIKYSRTSRDMIFDYYLKAGYKAYSLLDGSFDNESIVFLGFNRDCFRRLRNNFCVSAGVEAYGFAFEFSAVYSNDGIFDVEKLSYYKRTPYLGTVKNTFRFETKLIIKLFGNSYK